MTPGDEKLKARRSGGSGRPLAGLATVLVLVALAGCSERQVYDSLQTQQRSRCVNEPAVRYRECLEQAGGSYEEYEQARAESRDGA